MRALPTVMVLVLAPFVPLFSERVWRHAQVLLAGTILAPGKRTVTAALRVMGLDQNKQFYRYHRVLNRAKWSGREAARVLCGRSNPTKIVLNSEEEEFRMNHDEKRASRERS